MGPPFWLGEAGLCSNYNPLCWQSWKAAICWQFQSQALSVAWFIFNSFEFWIWFQRWTCFIQNFLVPSHYIYIYIIYYMVNQSLYKGGRSPDAAGSTRTSLLRRSFRWCPWFAKILWRTKFPSRLGFKLFETSFYRGYNLLLERLVDKFQPKQSFKLWATCIFKFWNCAKTIVKRPPIYHISYSRIGFLSGIPGIIHGPFWQDELWWGMQTVGFRGWLSEGGAVCTGVQEAEHS